MVLKSRPPLQEILKILRANMPALLAEYGVISLAVIGPYAKGDDYEASRLDLMVDFERPLGLKFFGMDDDLGDLLGVKVHVVTKSVIVERESHLLDERGTSVTLIHSDSGYLDHIELSARECLEFVENLTFRRVFQRQKNAGPQ